jgi:hypothetical protein
MNVSQTYLYIGAVIEEKPYSLDTGVFFRYTFLVLMVSYKIFNTLDCLLFYPA